jgi:GH25 family lysozyme M1 (1,4-beta-N-acetylmuramidase)
VRGRLIQRVARLAPSTLAIALVAILIAAGGALAVTQSGGKRPTADPGTSASSPSSQPLQPDSSADPSISPGSSPTGSADSGSATTASSALSAGSNVPHVVYPVSHPQEDHLGSTICAHEQCDPLPTAPSTSSGSTATSSTPASQPAARASTPASKAPAAKAPTSTGTSKAAAPTTKPTHLPTTTPTVPKPPTVTAKPTPKPVPKPAPKPTVPPVTNPGPPPQGMDVSSHQGNVDWRTAYSKGARFAYVKATESTGYTNPYFSQQYNGSKSAGLVRGAYHFALPNRSSGATQADYFIAHGGNWASDGSTLPPMLDIEYDPYGSNICYGMSGSAMSRWISDFSARIHSRTGRNPTIYTTRNWWNTCTGSNGSFGSNPLFLACYCRTVGRMPAGWSHQTIWQYNSQGTFPGDQDVFNGSYADLRRFALA